MAYQRVSYCNGTITSGEYQLSAEFGIYEDFDDPTNNPPYAAVSSGLIYASSEDLLLDKNATITATIDGTTITGTVHPIVSNISGRYVRQYTFAAADNQIPITVNPGETFHAIVRVYVAPSTSMTVSGFCVLPKKITITPPATVRTDAPNYFSCTPFVWPRVSGSKITGYYIGGTGKIKNGGTKSRSLFVNASTMLSSDVSTVTGFYWYPSHEDAPSSAFPQGVGEYELSLDSWVNPSTAGSFHSSLCFVFSTAEGDITYSETPDASAAPTASIITSEAAGQGILAQYGKYIKGKSQVRFTGVDTYKYGAQRKTRSFTVGGIWVSTYGTTVAVTTDGQAVLSVEDDYGNTASATVSYEVYDYWDPTLAEFSIRRCRQDGTPDDTAGYCKITYQVSIAPLGDQNTKTLSITHPAGTSDITLNSYSQSGELIVAADTEHSYDITATVGDDFTSQTRTLRLSTAGVTLDVYHGGTGLGIGKVCEATQTVDINRLWTVLAGAMQVSSLAINGTDLMAVIAAAVATSSAQFFHYTGLVAQGSTSIYGKQTGTADILRIGNLALVFFCVSQTSSASSTSNTWGVDPSLFETLCGFTITPVDGGVYFWNSNTGSISTSSTECSRTFKAITSGDSNYWSYATVNSSGTVSQVAANKFGSNAHIMGLCFGTIASS